MGSWMAPKNADTCRRTISKQHASSSKAGGAADLSGNKLGTFATKIMCKMFFTHVSIQEAQQTKRSVGVPFDRLATLGHAANTS